MCIRDSPTPDIYPFRSVCYSYIVGTMDTSSQFSQNFDNERDESLVFYLASPCIPSSTDNMGASKTTSANTFNNTMKIAVLVATAATAAAVVTAATSAISAASYAASVAGTALGRRRRIRVVERLEEAGERLRLARVRVGTAEQQHQRADGARLGHGKPVRAVVGERVERA